MRGRSAEGMERNRADHMGMLATAINSLALQDALEQLGVPCVVQSAVDMDRFCEPFSARSAKHALNEGQGRHLCLRQRLPVFFDGYGGGPARGGDRRGRAAAGKKHRRDLFRRPESSTQTPFDTAASATTAWFAENLRATDLTAITLCKEQKIPIRVFALDQIEQILEDDSIGTHIVEKE